MGRRGMGLTLTLLGCGSSGGVPRIGADGWGACNPENPRNRRSRCSALIRKTTDGGETVVLIDTSPDLRAQLLAARVERLDGIVYTHDHADHTHGIDDVRPLIFTARRRIDVYMDDATSRGLNARFRYIFQTPEGSSYPPLLTENRIQAGAAFTIDGPGGAISILPFRVHHGDIDALGLRLGDLVYTPDINGVPDESLPHLSGLSCWVVDALRERAHPTHFCLSETLDWIERVKPTQAVLTNLHNDLDYDALKARLPQHVEPAYDGMVLDV